MASLFSNDFLNEKDKNELIEIIEIQREVYRDDLIFETGNEKTDKTLIFKSLKQ